MIDTTSSCLADPDSPDDSAQESGDALSFPSPAAPVSSRASGREGLLEENTRLRQALTIVEAQLMIAEARLEMSAAPDSGNVPANAEGAVSQEEKLPQEYARRLEEQEKKIALLETENKRLQAQWKKSASMLLDAVKRTQHAEGALSALRGPS